MRAFVEFLVGVGLVMGTASGQPTAPAPAAPQATTQQEIWTVSDTRIAVVPARVAFPRTAGTVVAYDTSEFSHRGEGLDMGIQYRSPDQAVFATVYVYYPGLAHAGLAAFATDDAIRRNSNSAVRGGLASVVSAGGVEGVAIRRDYSGYRGNLASTAAFIKLDRWLVKVRVSGPDARRAEVMEAMDRLLANIQFGRQFRPRPATMIEITDCLGARQQAARELAEPVGPESAAHAFLGTLDGGGIAATNEGGARQDLPSRVPVAMCVSQRAHLGDLVIPILRGSEGTALSIDGRTMLLAVLTDAGETIEVVHAANLRRYWLLRHRIGETLFLRSYDGVPSDEQVLRALDDNMAGRRPVNIRVRLSPDERHQLFVPGAEPQPSTPPRSGA
jgi:hypothetical protein